MIEWFKSLFIGAEYRRSRREQRIRQKIELRLWRFCALTLLDWDSLQDDKSRVYSNAESDRAIILATPELIKQMKDRNLIDE